MLMLRRFNRKTDSLIALPFAAVLAFGAATYGLVSTMVSWPAPAGAADSSQSADLWRVLFIIGGAEGRAPSGEGTWVPLAVGSILEPGSEIRTAAAAEVYLGSGERSLNVEPNSRIELPPPNRAPATRVMQWFGGDLRDRQRTARTFRGRHTGPRCRGERHEVLRDRGR